MYVDCLNEDQTSFSYWSLNNASRKIYSHGLLGWFNAYYYMHTACTWPRQPCKAEEPRNCKAHAQLDFLIRHDLPNRRYQCCNPIATCWCYPYSPFSHHNWPQHPPVTRTVIREHQINQALKSRPVIAPINWQSNLNDWLRLTYAGCRHLSSRKLDSSLAVLCLVSGGFCIVDLQSALDTDWACRGEVIY